MYKKIIFSLAVLLSPSCYAYSSSMCAASTGTPPAITATTLNTMRDMLRMTQENLAEMIKKYNLPSDDTVVERYAIRDPKLRTRVEEALEEYRYNNAIAPSRTPDHETCYYFGTSAYQTSSLSEGHSLVIESEKLPGYLIKFDHAIERLLGLEVLKFVRQVTGADYLELPVKFIHLTKINRNRLAYVIVEKKLSLQEDDVNSFGSSEKPSPLVEKIIETLAQAGYCDAHDENIKRTSDNSYAVIDTDITFFDGFNSTCGRSSFYSGYSPYSTYYSSSSSR